MTETGSDLSWLADEPTNAAGQAECLGVDVSAILWAGLCNRDLTPGEAPGATGLPELLVERADRGDPTLTLAEVAEVASALGLRVGLEARVAREHGEGRDARAARPRTEGRR